MDKRIEDLKKTVGILENCIQLLASQIRGMMNHRDVPHFHTLFSSLLMELPGWDGVECK